MTKLIWEKIYKGPFTIEEAGNIVDELKAEANPEKNLIYDAAVRRRKTGDEQYDVYIKTERYENSIR